MELKTATLESGSLAKGTNIDKLRRAGREPQFDSHLILGKRRAPSPLLLSLGRKRRPDIQVEDISPSRDSSAAWKGEDDSNGVPPVPLGKGTWAPQLQSTAGPRAFVDSYVLGPPNPDASHSDLSLRDHSPASPALDDDFQDSESDESLEDLDPSPPMSV